MDTYFSAQELAREFFARVPAGDGFTSADPERGRFCSYPSDEIASTLEVPEQTADKWRRRFCLNGMKGLEDAARAGRPLKLGVEKINRVLTEVTKPPGSRSQWITRSPAGFCGRLPGHWCRLPP